VISEGRQLQLATIQTEIRQLEELRDRAPIGSVYWDDLTAKKNVLVDRYYEVLRSGTKPQSIENPASAFIAQTIAEKITGLPWSEIRPDWQHLYSEVASHVVIEMYDAGFVIPQPTDPEAVWAAIKEKNSG
jgi:hypothetical protein